MHRTPRDMMLLVLLACLLAAPQLSAQVQAPAAQPERVLHVVGTAHLDTQWRWTIQRTIDDYIKNTMVDNFKLFDQFPHYRFSFEGAFRYELMKEYYPADYARVKGYVRTGQWNVTGSSYDAGDVNIPSPESIFRHALYGNGFFKKEFGKTSVDIYLPDCFGFGYALPTIARHAGLSGFSTQKLTWGSFVGIPFNIGMWEGVDGSKIVGTVNPGDYGARIREDLSQNERWLRVIDSLGTAAGLYRGYKYFGTGDVGGAPDSASVAWLERSIAGKGPVKVISAPADSVAREVTPARAARLPQYKGELLMSTHGTGCYTSQTAMKLWNRKNELLADAAERASVTAAWMGGLPYPTDRLTTNWKRFLWHQFHDDLTGTSIPEAYAFSWNDELLSLNGFSSILGSAVGSLALGLDTRVAGIPVVVYNPLSRVREDVVEGTFLFPGGVPRAVKVVDAKGMEAPSQIVGTEGNAVRVQFVATVPSVGFRVYGVQASAQPTAIPTGLRVTQNALENNFYRVGINASGDVASIYDKVAGRELLKAPMRLDMFHHVSEQWPAWEILAKTVMAPPRASVGGPVSMKIVESGAAAVALQIVRRADGSTFTQTIRLQAGDAGRRVVIVNDVRWNTRKTLLKASFPLAVANEHAVYDLGMGVIERGNNTQKLYEVPAQQWAGIDARDGAYGVAIINDSRYGWDKPDDNTLRLTLVHTPETGSGYADHANQDLGKHHVTYAVYGHAGRWQEAHVAWQAARLNQPLIAFQTTPHEGVLGPEFSFLSTSSDGIMVTAIKKAEGSNAVIVRLRELTGRPQSNTRVTFPSRIVSAVEMTAAEEPLGPATAQGSALAIGTIGGYSPKTYAITLEDAGFRLPSPVSQPIDLPFDLDGMSLDANRADGDLDGAGHTLPGELVPATLEIDGVTFTLGASAPGVKNVLTAKGTTLKLPAGTFDHLYLLAAATEDARVSVRVDGTAHMVTVPRFMGNIGQWDSQLINERSVSLSRINGAFVANTFFTPAYMKPQQVALTVTHMHDGRANRNIAYVFGYMFLVKVPVPRGASSVTLPDDPRVRIFAASVAQNPLETTREAGGLAEVAPVVLMSTPAGVTVFHDTMSVRLTSSAGTGVIRYTVDGSAPVASSPVATGPVLLKASTTVKAAVFSPSGRPGEVSSGEFVKIAFLQPETVTSGTPGVRYEYYGGAWSKLPDFNALKAVHTGTMPAFTFPGNRREDGWGVRYTGYLKVLVDGIYTFSVSSDDGSRLFIGSTEVLDNDGSHSANEMAGAVALEAGMHRITVLYFDDTEGESLDVSYEGPGIPRQRIPAGVLLH